MVVENSSVELIIALREVNARCGIFVKLDGPGHAL